MPKTFQRVTSWSRAGIIESIIGLALLGIMVGNLSGCGDSVEESGAAFVAISGGSKIEVPDSTKYNLPFTLLVTSKEGDPVEGAVVDLKIYPTQYYKGYKDWDGSRYLQYYPDGLGGVSATTSSGTPTPVPCANEDANKNGILDGGEDVNGNGQLDPGIPVSFASSGTATGNDGAELTGRVRTDEQGFADFTLNYGKDYALYLSVKITATTSATGTEGKDTHTVPFLFIEKSEMTSNDAVPGDVSPFGTAASCSDPS